MAKPDDAHRWTDEALRELEGRISDVYREAYEELNDTVKAYFASFEKRDAEQKKRVESGEITEEYYKQWRLNQIGRGKRFEALRDQIAKRMTEANETAVAYVNDATPSIYSLNRNYAAYRIEQEAGLSDFALWDEATVRRLIVERPDLMPYYPEEKAIDRGIDLAYGRNQITKSVTGSILMGKSIQRMADDLQNRIMSMSRPSAIRTARTAVTGAQNAGRMDTYHAAQGMGIRLKKQWLATLDGRTRHSHAWLDEVTAEVDEPFQSELGPIMYPGDRGAEPANVYNCRCTLVSVLADVDTSSAQRRARDPETGESVLIEDMSYPEWAGWKKAVEKSENHDTMEKTGGGGFVQTIGKIDIQKYKGISEKRIRSEKLVLTDNQKQHIIQRRGKNFFEKYSPYFSDIAENPDYIFKDKAHENTAIASKTIEVDGKSVNLVIRLAVEGDDIKLENSLITAIVENSRRYQQRLRNNIPLYKSE